MNERTSKQDNNDKPGNGRWDDTETVHGEKEMIIADERNKYTRQKKTRQSRQARDFVELNEAHNHLISSRRG